MSVETIGFPSQILKKSIQDIFSDPTITDKVKTSINRVSEMTSAWWQEYIAKYPVISFPLEMKNDRLYQPRWDGYLTNATQETERNGAPLSSIKAIEKFLVQSQEPALGFFTSPPGPSGLYQDGKEIIYPNSQTYIYYKDQGGSVTSFTLITDLTIEEANNLAKRYKSGVDSNPTAVTVTGSPVISNSIKPTDVINTIIQIEAKRFWKSKSPSDWNRIKHLANHLNEADEAWNGFSQAQQKLADYITSIEATEAEVNESDYTLNFIVQGAIKLVEEIERESRKEFAKSQQKSSEYVWATSAGTTQGTCSTFGGSAIYSIGGFRETTFSGDCPKIECKSCDWKAEPKDFDESGKLKHTSCPNCGWSP